MSTNSYVGGAQMNHQQNHHHHQQHHHHNQAPGQQQQQLEAPSNEYQQQQQQQVVVEEQQQQTQPQQQPEVYEQQQQSTGGQAPIAYMKLDGDRQQNHLAQHQAAHQAQLAEIMQQNTQDSTANNYQTTTPMSLTTLAVAVEQQQEAERQQEVQQQEQHPEQQQQQAPVQQTTDANANGANGYLVEQVPSRPSVQSQPDSLLVNESPIQMPIMDQQSLIQDASPDTENSYETMSEDDATNKQRQQSSQPAGVYQVYQAYYAPKDHKPLPGYVRLSLEEFNNLFKDAEIQYVDRNLNGMSGQSNQQQQQQAHQQPAQMLTGGYEHQTYGTDQMKSAASELQSILVDGRSIASRSISDKNSTSFGATGGDGEDRRLRLGQAVKKIISIRNSRHLAKQSKSSKLVMKRVKPQTLTTSSESSAATTTTISSSPTTSQQTPPTLSTTAPTTTTSARTGKSRKVGQEAKSTVVAASNKSSKVIKSKKTEAVAKKAPGA